MRDDSPTALHAEHAPGHPGIAPRWTSSAKSGVGTALGGMSRLWFTLSHGIVNEVYYHRVDQACIRDLGLIVTDGKDFFSEEKRHTRPEIAQLDEGVPAYRLVNSCLQGRYRIEKEVLADPHRDVLLQHVRFVSTDGGSYRLHVLLAPHLGNRGAENIVWVGDYKGVPLLFAERHGRALALACSAPWVQRSAGFVGVSDLWQDLQRHRRMTWVYDRAGEGNVAIGAEIDITTSPDGFVLSLGFGRNAQEAGQRAVSSLLEGFAPAKQIYIEEWQKWQRTLTQIDPSGESGPGSRKLRRIGAAVLRTHEEKRFPGALIASLSIPWGCSKSDDDIGGYHLVWPRDLIESAGGLLAAGDVKSALQILRYLQVTQESDGHWAQNLWVDGEPYWNGIQMDETALPILLVDLARREQALSDEALRSFWPMVKRAAAFIARNGPVTAQDRWENDPGYSPFTLAAEIAALLVAAELAELVEKDGEKDGAGAQLATYLRETADAWNESIERWIYLTDPGQKKADVDGYYVRIAIPTESTSALNHGYVPIKACAHGGPAATEVSPDALALVRFGLRAADDPRILNTITVIDAKLKVNTPVGPVWRRYASDPYGEHPDGRPYDGRGIGRPWPLLTGERAHYELSAGHRDESLALLQTLEACANDGGLFPEQVWDGPDIPARELFAGKPTGSAMPLCWAHAEHLKLCRSLRENRVFDQPPQTVKRYLQDKQIAAFGLWRFNQKITQLPSQKTLRIEVLVPAIVHFSSDGWKTARDLETRDTGLGMHIADLPTADLPGGSAIDFTFFWKDAAKWEGRDFKVRVSR